MGYSAGPPTFDLTHLLGKGRAAAKLFRGKEHRTMKFVQELLPSIGGFRQDDAVNRTTPHRPAVIDVQHHHRMTARREFGFILKPDAPCSVKALRSLR
jgi:hypothetical protein